MIKSVADRIQERMSELNLSQADLMRLTKASRGTVSGWVNGSNNPSAKHIENLASALKTTTSWILTGVTSTTPFQSVDVWDSDTPLDDDEVEIPFFDDFSFACGSGAIGEALKTQTQKLRLPKATLRNLGIEKANAAATGSSGNSMYPTIKDGDTIHIDLGRKTVKDGKIFAICHGGLFMAKRLYNLPMGGIRIVSDNAVEYPEIQLTADQIREQEFEIVGWIWRISTTETW